MSVGVGASCIHEHGCCGHMFGVLVCTVVCMCVGVWV